MIKQIHLTANNVWAEQGEMENIVGRPKYQVCVRGKIKANHTWMGRIFLNANILF